MTDALHKAGFNHPCKGTCSGWQQGYERGTSDTNAALEMAVEKLKFIRDNDKEWGKHGLSHGWYKEIDTLFEQMKSMRGT